MRTITVEDFIAELKAQGVAQEDLAFRCPMCGTIQSARDLIELGAGKDFGEVERYLAFSCIGRWTHGAPPPHPRIEGYQEGCNWTLGGLLPMHKLEVIDPSGAHHARFEPCSAEETKQHAARRRPADAGAA